MIINEQIPPRIQTLEKDTNCNCWPCCKAHALFNLLYMFFGICIIYIYNYIYIYMSTQHPTLQTFLAVQAQAKKNKCSLSDVLKHSWDRHPCTCFGGIVWCLMGLYTWYELWPRSSGFLFIQTAFRRSLPFGQNMPFCHSLPFTAIHSHRIFWGHHSMGIPGS